MLALLLAPPRTKRNNLFVPPKQPGSLSTLPVQQPHAFAVAASPPRFYSIPPTDAGDAGEVDEEEDDNGLAEAGVDDRVSPIGERNAAGRRFDADRPARSCGGRDGGGNLLSLDIDEVIDDEDADDADNDADDDSLRSENDGGKVVLAASANSSPLMGDTAKDPGGGGNAVAAGRGAGDCLRCIVHVCYLSACATYCRSGSVSRSADQPWHA
ncbi:hypothetical protein HK405_003522 [Cladochytrium tenue]|nr:hypothetical protein HK405_003522 [Cladochytrium tenue]